MLIWNKYNNSQRDILHAFFLLNIQCVFYMFNISCFGPAAFHVLGSCTWLVATALVSTGLK